MQALAENLIQWKKDTYFAKSCARQNLSKYYTEVPLPMGMFLISAHSLDPFSKSRSFRKWDKGMDINPEDGTSYTAQYQEACLKYVENKFCAKQRRLPVFKPECVLSNNLSSSAIAFRPGQSSHDPYDLSSDDEEYSMNNNVATMTPGQSDCTAHVLKVTWPYFNPLPESPKDWGQIHLNLNDHN